MVGKYFAWHWCDIAPGDYRPGRLILCCKEAGMSLLRFGRCEGGAEGARCVVKRRDVRVGREVVKAEDQGHNRDGEGTRVTEVLEQP